MKSLAVFFGISLPLIFANANDLLLTRDQYLSGKALPTRAWKFESDESDFILGNVLVSPNEKSVYVSSCDDVGSAYLLDARSGATNWEKSEYNGSSIERPSPAAFSPDSSIVYEGEGDSGVARTHRSSQDDFCTVLALSVETGQNMWANSSCGVGIVASKPVISKNGKTVFVTNNNGDLKSPTQLFSLDSINGTHNWVFTTKGCTEDYPTLSAFAPSSGESVFLVSSCGQIYAVSSISGKQQWVQDTECEGLTFSPDSTTVYVQESQGLTALRTPTGVVSWARTGFTPTSVLPSADGEHVYVLSEHHVRVLTASTGDIVHTWPYTFGDTKMTTPDGNALVVCTNSSVYALSLADGAKLWEFVIQPKASEYPNLALDVSSGMAFCGVGKEVFAVRMPAEVVVSVN